MAEHLTRAAGWPWLAGLLLAAPFAAVMSTCDSFLLMVSSALVRDVYQRNINPNASDKKIRRLSYAATTLVGIAALWGALNPPVYLQDIIVYTGSGLGACFLAPMALGLYWTRMNTPGALAGMLAGFFTHMALYGGGFILYGRLQPICIYNFDPLIPAMFISLIVSLLAALMTEPPSRQTVRKFFYR